MELENMVDRTHRLCAFLVRGAGSGPLARQMLLLAAAQTIVIALRQPRHNERAQRALLPLRGPPRQDRTDPSSGYGCYEPLDQ